MIVRSPFLQHVGGTAVQERTQELKVVLGEEEFERLCRQRGPLADGEVSEFMMETKLYLPEGVAERTTAYRVLEVEINRHCNFRCTFCPVATDPHPRGFISDETFQLALERAAEFGIRGISLNHYSEPTLHPKLIEHVRAAVERGHWIRLCTNASLLDEAKIEAMAAIGSIHLQINLPAIDEAGFIAATGAKAGMFLRVIKNIDRILAHKIPGQLVVNRTDRDTRPEVLKLTQRFGGGSLQVTEWATDSRAGRLTHVGRRVDHGEQHLTGCHFAADQLQVSADGEVFLCCQDYAQRHTFGHLRDASLAEIVDSDAFVRTRRVILGLDPVPPGMICSRCEHTRVHPPDGRPVFGSRDIAPEPSAVRISPNAGG